MRFCEIVGQEDVKKRLRQSVQEGRIAHAQLFSGISGVGKLALAIAYAQYLACPHRTQNDSCGQCPSCLQYQKLQHPDLHFVFPIVKENSGDVCDTYADKWRGLVTERSYFDLEDWYRVLGTETKQGMIYENESTEIIRKLSLKSFSGGYKIMVIWQPEKMNTTCANKILKLLEEPPAMTLFLLVSEHPEQLLSTILSRVQEVRVPRLSEETIAAGLQREYTWLGSEEAQSIAHMANGSYLAALKTMNESADNKIYFDDFVSLMRNAWLVGQKKDYSALLKLRQWSTDMADSKVGREKQKAFCSFMSECIRKIFLIRQNLPQIADVREQEIMFYKDMAPKCKDSFCTRTVSNIEKVVALIDRNVSSKMLFCDLVNRMFLSI